MSKETAVATLTIHRAAEMTPEGRQDVVAWLRRQARQLSRDANKLAPRFTARYFAR